MFEHNHEFDLDSFLKNLTKHPGVYRMYDRRGEIIYVGKAKNLYNRVNSYFSKGAKDLKTTQLVEKVKLIDITVTPSDYEAYLLESTLIKKHRPRYNIFFKDDKSYPYLMLSKHDYPRLYGYRGKPKKGMIYFGPYVSLSSVKETLNLLQKLFPIRQCTDGYFNNRSRPCLQYQIGRCSAPCVHKITQADYLEQVKLLTQFIQGKLTSVLEQTADKMHQVADSEDFEQAVKLRDQLTLLTKLQQQQIVDKYSARSLDVIGIATLAKKACVTFLKMEQGKIVDDKYWIVEAPASLIEEVLSAFLSHYYLSGNRSLWPRQVILPKGINRALISENLAMIAQQAGHDIQWLIDTISDNASWQRLALVNAQQKLKMSVEAKGSYDKRWLKLKSWLDLEDLQRVECFDISHFQGEATVASCVVYNAQGPNKGQYRRYNIQGITPGDDYAAIAQAVTRRLEAAKDAQNYPDVLIIDGGKGQIHKAQEVLTYLKLQDKIQLVSLGKGVERISGKELIYKGYDTRAYQLPEHDLAFLLLRQIRDSAHDFAIKSQRSKVQKRQKESILESLPGIGAKRRKALLTHFGGWQELSRASINEIAKVQGISKALADSIWQAFR